MTNRSNIFACAAWLIVAAWITLAPAHADGPAQLTLGYLELVDDPRYLERRSYARIGLPNRSRPYAGAELGVADAAMFASAVDTKLGLERITGLDVAELIIAIKESVAEKGIHYFLMDLPTEAVRAVVAGTQDLDVLLFNISDSANALRKAECASHLIHIIPSLRMRTDALVQYLRKRNWENVLLLTGANTDDAAFAQSFRASARRYGLTIVKDEPFVLSNDPRQRSQSNVQLLTASRRDYDVVILADRDGEFARYIPFATNRPRPVMGSAGLDATPWHWTFERFGAPQLNSRFLRANGGRHMAGPDWAAWVAVKTIVHARVRGGSADFQDVSSYLRGETMKIDGFKGVALNIRPWNNQLRQPILLATHDAVIATAPVEGFLHYRNNLDTLGVDEKENTCVFP